MFLVPFNVIGQKRNSSPKYDKTATIPKTNMGINRAVIKDTSNLGKSVSFLQKARVTVEYLSGFDETSCIALL